jgi:hypothetical protein
MGILPRPGKASPLLLSLRTSGTRTIRHRSLALSVMRLLRRRRRFRLTRLLGAPGLFGSGWACRADSDSARASPVGPASVSAYPAARAHPACSDRAWACRADSDSARASPVGPASVSACPAARAHPVCSDRAWACRADSDSAGLLRLARTALSVFRLFVADPSRLQKAVTVIVAPFGTFPRTNRSCTPTESDCLL